MEIWKDIYFIKNKVVYDYRGLYQVSNMGRIKSLNYNHCTGKEKILKLQKDRKGYPRINLYKNGKMNNFHIHRLVAYMFIDGYFDGAEIDHINTDKTDNRVENLRFVTHKENMNNPLSKQKISETNKGENHPLYGRTGKSNPKSKKVMGISLTEKKIIILHSATEAEKFGFYHSAICNCCNGKLKQYKGFKWKYLEEE